MRIPSPEEAGIRETINRYSEGLREGSVDTLKEAFRPEAVMCGYLGETLIVTPIEGLYDYVRSNPAPARSGEPYSCSVSSIDVAGSVASVRITERSYQGHDFIDFLHLLKVDGRWWIVSKVFNLASPGE
jgi:hypothetical protein